MKTTIDELTADKKALEENITRLINEFIGKHGLSLDVDVEVIEIFAYPDNGISKIANTKIKVIL